jgi:hypothetical protein
LVDDLIALGQAAGGDGRATLSVHAGIGRTTRVSIWISLVYGFSITIDADTIEDAFMNAWVAVHRQEEKTRLHEIIYKKRHYNADAIA